MTYNDHSGVFVGYQNGDRGATAAFLLSLADEKGIDRRAIKTTRGGFRVPAELLLVEDENGNPVDVLAGPVPPIADPKAAEPPAGFVVREVDVEFVDGKVFLKDAAAEAEKAAGELVVHVGEAPDASLYAANGGQEAHTTPELNEILPGVGEDLGEVELDREEVRAWAKANGFTVADKGQLKKSVYDAYLAAH